MVHAEITPVILAGGKGTRLWPLSRTDLPKQFCKLGNDLTLFQQTITRICNQNGIGAPVILTNAAHLSVVRSQMAEVGVVARMIVCEPCGRDTAPAIALAAHLGKRAAMDQMLVLPSDHLIRDAGAFLEAVHKASAISREMSRIVTFGIKPDGPATGYGYLEAGNPLADGIGAELSCFIEKPDVKTAKKLITKDNVFWNAGVFLFSPGIMCRELEVHAPDLSSKVKQALYCCSPADEPVMPDVDAFSAIRPISIDYAVMEKTSCAALVPVDPDWSDVGSWDAVWKKSSQDEAGNAVLGRAVCSATSNSYLSSDGPLLAVSGLEDVVVVANRDAVLVSSRKDSEGVKALIEKVKDHDESLTRSHVHETRPWGAFTSLHKGEGHQVKTISVHPGGQLSLQYHFHRAEHWIVVKGMATVTVGDERMVLGPCQQVFIPQGAVHRLENEGESDVEIIEVQYGAYLGEDDIVRVEDVYGRPEAGNREVERRLAEGRGR